MSDTANLSAAERAEIVAACERLCLDYAHVADFEILDQRGAQFAEDAEMHLWGKVLAGQPAIRQFLLSRDPSFATMHAISNLRIDVISAERAEGSCYVTCSVGKKQAEGLPPLTTIIRGCYIDSFKRTKSGWKIAKRVVKDFIAHQSVAG